MRRTLWQLACTATYISLSVHVGLGVEPPFSVTLNAPDKPIKAGTDLRLLATVKNISDHDIPFVRSPGLIADDGFRYNINVLDAQAHAAPPSARVLKLRRLEKEGKPVESWSSDISQLLKPGQSFVDAIGVTEYYDLSRPGIYTIWVSRPMPPKLTPHGVTRPPGSVKSNTITVTLET